MIIVFYLSEPVDFSPIYEIDLPVELIGSQLGSNLDKLTGRFREYFPDADYFVIDGGAKPSYHKISGKIDTLNFPSSKIFTKLFLFSAFSTINILSPVTIFIPGNLMIKNFEKLSEKLRVTAKNSISNSGFTFFSAEKGNYLKYIERGETILRNDDFILNGIKDFVTITETNKWMEKNKNIKFTDKFLGQTNIFSFNNIKFCEILSNLSGDKDEGFLQPLYYLLTDAFKDEKSINTVMPEIILKLDSLSFEKFINAVEEKFTVPVDSEFMEIDGLTGLLNTLPLDENGNYILGDVKQKGITNSLIINENGQPLIVSNMNGVLVLSKNGITRIESL